MKQIPNELAPCGVFSLTAAGRRKTMADEIIVKEYSELYKDEVINLILEINRMSLIYKFRKKTNRI